MFEKFAISATFQKISFLVIFFKKFMSYLLLGLSIQLFSMHYYYQGFINQNFKNPQGQVLRFAFLQYKIPLLLNLKIVIIKQMQQVQIIKDTALKADKLMENLREKIKTFTSQHEQILSPDQKRILKLFNYTKWSDFMRWIEQKLADSADIDESRLSQIEEESAQMQESISEHVDKNETMMLQDKSECELLAMENSKLRRENMSLQTKIQHLSKLYNTSRSRIHHRR